MGGIGRNVQFVAPQTVDNPENAGAASFLIKAD
jgi:hypothetical protein